MAQLNDLLILGKSTMVGELNILNKIVQGRPSTDSTIMSMNRLQSDLYVSGDGSAPNSPKVAGFYLGKSTSDENRHMDIVSGADFSYIDFNKASTVEDFKVRLIANVSSGLTELNWAPGAADPRFNINGTLSFPNGSKIKAIDDSGGYGCLRIYGGDKGGYEGIHFGSNNTGLTIMNSEPHQGLYNESHGRWMFYYKRDANLISIGSATVRDGYINIAGNIYSEGNIFINNGGHGGIGLYNNSSPNTYGIHMSVTSSYGTYGQASSDWATYFCFDGDVKRGWIFKHADTNVFSINGQGTLSIRENVPGIFFRPGHASYDANISYQTSGNEAMVFTTKNPVTSFIFVNGEDTVTNIAADRWTKVTPTLQIKGGGVAVNKLIANAADPAYALDVNGTGYFAKTLTVDGLLVTQFKNAIAMGSYESTQTTVDGLVNEIRYSNGACGSVNITSTYTATGGGTIAAGWYNFFYSPHRIGGNVGGTANGDNHQYGTLILYGMTVGSAHWRIRVASGSIAESRRIWNAGDAVTGAVWNDYAEYRKSDCENFGYVLCEKGDDTLTKATERLSHFAGVSSDTWGFSQGKTEQATTPIAVAGRVLVYPYQNKMNYKPGDCVCAAPGGTVDIMTREEVIQYPDRMVGTVSCVPDYEEWGGGEGADRDPVKVNGRIWIKVK